MILPNHSLPEKSSPTTTQNGSDANGTPLNGDGASLTTSYGTCLADNEASCANLAAKRAFSLPGEVRFNLPPLEIITCLTPNHTAE